MKSIFRSDFFHSRQERQRFFYGKVNKKLRKNMEEQHSRFIIAIVVGVHKSVQFCVWSDNAIPANKLDKPQERLALHVGKIAWHVWTLWRVEKSFPKIGRKEKPVVVEWMGRQVTKLLYVERISSKDRGKKFLWRNICQRNGNISIIYIYKEKNVIDTLLTFSIQNSSEKCFAYFNKMKSKWNQ